MKSELEQKPKAPGFIAWFPWEKLTIWGLFLLAVYALRHFFFTIFMTFMITYIMRNVVRSVVRILSPETERAWLQRMVSLVGFALLIGVLYGVGTFLYHPLRKQVVDFYNEYVVNYESRYDDLLRRTMGAWLYESHYRDKGKEEEQKDLEKFKKEKYTAQAYEAFHEWVIRFAANFKNQVINEEGAKKLKELEDEGKENTALLAWMFEHIDENKFEKMRADLIKDWVKNKEDIWIAKKVPGGMNPNLSREEIRNLPEYQKDRDQEIKDKFIESEMAQDRDRYLKGFKEYIGTQEYSRLATEGKLEDRRRGFYESQQPSLGTPRYDYEKFKKMRAAMEESKQAFEAALGEKETPQEREDRIKKEFIRWNEDKFVKDKLSQEEWSFLKLEKLESRLRQSWPDLGKWIANAGLYLVQLLIQFGFSLLLSFFITFDLFKLRRGIQKLEQSPIRDFYLEIAPGLINFGRLIGRSFQAQGLIAICNTLLTFTAIKILGIQNEVFLSSVVFLCSFIPILGVVISSVPIAAMAIVQPGGGIVPDGLLLALLAIAAILVVHFIETSILNPKIVGDMLHLHPVMVLGILAVGEYFFGIWGLLLGVPVAVYIYRYVILREELVFGRVGARAKPSLPGGPPPAPPPQKPAIPPAEPVGAGSAKK